MDRTGQPATAATVSAALVAAGYTVGHVTSGAAPTGTAPVSAIEYRAAELAQATRLADVLHETGALRQARVPGITLLLTPTDPLKLLAALAALPAECAAGAPAPTATPTPTP